ncbi:unnamed protein product [Pleuronectes platessa]|uniref:Uncharacterized protein n=1 Tax=Pleuronectes platessa TaxID=8262 RepID=A0A9N7Z9I9_PLEPL|nr:unnamed protein product [Pleuronectes platessa]
MEDGLERERKKKEEVRRGEEEDTMREAFFWTEFEQVQIRPTDASGALAGLSGGRPATHTPSQPGQDKSRGSSHYGGSQGVLKPLYAPQRQRQSEATRLSGALQSRKDPSHRHLHGVCMFKGK